MTRMRIVAMTDCKTPFRALEQRQQVLVGPSRIAERPPGVEATPIATRVDHRIDRARPAEDAATRCGHATLRQRRLRLCGVVPVVLRADERRPSARRGYRRIVLAGVARLDEQNANRGICGQTIDDNAARGSGADDDEVGFSDWRFSIFDY